jgi:hypothetical protein
MTQSLKYKHTYGYDEVLTGILTISAPYILSPLTYSIKRWQQEHSDRLKFSEEKPLSKKELQLNFLVTVQYLF